MRTGRMLLYLMMIAATFGFAGCSATGKLATQNIAGFYKPDLHIEGLSYSVFNLDDSLTNLYFRFPLSELKYQQIAGSKPFARYRIDYQLYDGYEKGVLMDSGSYRGVDSLLFSGLFEDSIIIKAGTGKNYIIQVVLTDINTSNSHGQYINLPKLLHNGPADYILTDLNNKPLMRSFLRRNEKVRIRARFPQDSVIRFNHYVFNEQVAATAPFIYPLDSQDNPEVYAKPYEIFFRNNISDPFQPEGEGLYVDRLTNGKNLLFCRFYDGFPEIGSVIKMREAIRFISTDEEYKKMLGQPPRQAVDDFWIGLTGNPERALSQIKRYYGRVEFANELFSSVIEGWKSDRGMIFIVFGSPSIVYRNSGVEEWTYGEPGSPLSFRFYFHKTVTIGGAEDYVLSRSEDYRRPWHLAVSNWRR
ncbi:MAG: GWxTD domain-containing protein [Bacteroidales bacterium]|nr:GWxTD domain-containing protein [Bacteroidales bacterium]